MSYTLTILIPAYNEEDTITAILEQVKKVQLLQNTQKEIIVVDDASKDKTKEKVEAFQVQNPDLSLHYHAHSVNKGKGAALHTGIALATGDFLIIQDADLEYKPEEYNLLLRPVLEGVADVVYGSRFMGGRPHRILFFWHSIGNKWLTFLSNRSK
ncbi:MAG: glycosyltransferase family 2 protein, partial [Bacteroidota bacterium]